MLEYVHYFFKVFKRSSQKNLKIISIDSNINSNLNLCKIVIFGGFSPRTNLTEPDKLIQTSLIKMSRFQSVPRHMHLPIERYTVGTNEGWLVLNGEFEAEIFDINHSSRGSYSLKKFDMILMFQGGHSLRAIKNNSVIFEFKNGPFEGSDSDKIYF